MDSKVSLNRLAILSFSLVGLVMLAACGASTEQVTPTTVPTHSESSQEAASTPTVFQPTSSSTATATATNTPGTTATAIPTRTAITAQETSTPPTAGFPNLELYTWQQIISGLNRPVGLANAGDGSERLFVIEQSGTIRVVGDGELQPESFLDITGRLSCCGERGLLGLAFSPNFSQNGFFFVNYTDQSGNTVIARYQVSENSGQADPETEIKLLVVDQPFSNHNGGGLAFGPDGYLYVALGDGGSGGDPQGNAQNTSSLLGKLLRLDVDQVEGYGIPPDNPFAGGGGAPEVWSYGLRNPWRFTFDRLTGDLFIGDVGQGSWEEIDFLPAERSGGANFGWNFREGSHPYAAVSAPEGLELIDPIAEYGRDQGYTVIGGVVYRGEKLPEWNGIYFYGDYGSGFIWGLYPAQGDTWENQLLFQTGSSITAFGEDDGGDIYYVALDGSLYQLVIK